MPAVGAAAGLCALSMVYSTAWGGPMGAAGAAAAAAAATKLIYILHMFGPPWTACALVASEVAYAYTIKPLLLLPGLQVRDRAAEEQRSGF